MDQATLGVLAIVLGAAAGVVLFVPFVALSYRRRGGLSTGRTMLWIAALVYFWAIWTYTLLPLPDPEALRCAGVNLDVWQAAADVRGAIVRGHPLADPGLLQLALNVLLFLPLGFFVRVLGGRGILVALAAGLATSLFIETTQLAGRLGGARGPVRGGGVRAGVHHGRGPRHPGACDRPPPGRCPRGVRDRCRVTPATRVRRRRGSPPPARAWGGSPGRTAASGW